MKARQHFWDEKEEFRSYLSQINRDSWFLKGQLIFGGIVLVGVICFLLWIMP